MTYSDTLRQSIEAEKQSVDTERQSIEAENQNVDPQKQRPDLTTAHAKMKDLSPDQLPTEKCLKYGADALTDEELLAVIFRFGTGRLRVTQVARSVIECAEGYGGIAYLDRIPLGTLQQIEGVGQVRSVQLRCLSELARRMWEKGGGSKKERITSGKDVFEMFLPTLKPLEVEETWALYLDGKNGIIKKKMMTRGSVNSSMVSEREIFRDALLHSAVGIILIHNHPSGDPSPSLDDLEVTRKLRNGADLLGINLMDHVIIGDNNFISLKERGIL